MWFQGAKIRIIYDFAIYNLRFMPKIVLILSLIRENGHNLTSCTAPQCVRLCCETCVPEGFRLQNLFVLKM